MFNLLKYLWGEEGSEVTKNSINNFNSERLLSNECKWKMIPNRKSTPPPHYTNFPRFSRSEGLPDLKSKLKDARQVPYPLPARFKFWWQGKTFYSYRPIIGLFDLSHMVKKSAGLYKNLYIYFACLFVGFVSNKRQNDWTLRTKTITTLGKISDWSR